MKKSALLLSSAFLIMACSKAPSADQMAKDPELLASVLLECSELAIKGEDTDIAKCNNANKAQQQLLDDAKKELDKLLGN